MSSCLCLGPRQSGKTQLLTSIQSPGTITSVSHFVPTIGTNIFTIKIPATATTTTKSAVTVTSSASTATCSKQKKAAVAAKGVHSKNPEINILEIGGSMAPMWTNYLTNVSKIMYVVDTSNLCQISAAGKALLPFIN